MNKLIPILCAIAFLAAKEAKADNAAAFSSFTTSVSATVNGATEKVNCKGPVQLSVAVQRDASMPHSSSIVTVNTTALVCTGATSKAAYSNTGHAILTRVFGATDSLEAVIALFPSAKGGFMKARSATLTLNLKYNSGTAALVGASATLASL
jgi:hydroxyethylthiazole kinase-like sugar kinase family protein